MDGALVRVTLTLIAPALLLVFAAAFFGIWLALRRRRHVLCLAGACLGFALGALVQVLYLPRDAGTNALLSGALYTMATCLAGQGILYRSARPLRWASCAAFALLIMAALAYYFYVDRNLLARVYVLNVGYGLFFCLVALRIQPAIVKPVDRMLMWGVLVFGLHFLPRTLLTLGGSAPLGARAFADSIFWQALQLSLAIFCVGLAIALLAAIATDLIEEVRQEGERDWLTGALNRRGFEVRLRALGRTAPVEGALVVCDIDHFKRINDEHGHHGGDQVLRHVARVIVSTTRKADLTGRIGGEEFAVFLPGSDMFEARLFAERLRVAVEHSVATPDTGRPVTLSVGLAPLLALHDWESAFRRADQKLYEAKRSGRNQVVA